MKEKHPLITRLSAALLALLLLLPCFPFSLIGSAEERAVPEAPAELASDSVNQYLQKSIQVTDAAENFPNASVPATLLGIPVNLHFYYDSAREYPGNKEGVSGSVVVLYVMGTRVERIGTDADAEIVARLIDRGYYVIVMDYLENENAVSPYLDWSVQNLRSQIISGKIATPGREADGTSTGSVAALNYVLPAGYDIAYEVPYFAYDLHGAAGTLERIVEIWNNDFKSVKRESLVKWVDENGVPKLGKTDPITVKSVNDSRNIDYATWFSGPEKTKSVSQADLQKLSDEEKKAYPYTYIGNTKAETVYDCVKPDGSFIDLNLYMDILYPTGTEIDEVPVMVALSSGYTRASALTVNDRPQLSGFLFRGYAGVVSAYGLVPMARVDHYGYFCGDSQLNSVSGDNYTYSLSVYNGIKSDTAMLRALRKAAADGIEIDEKTQKFPFLADKIGVFGNSKAGVASRLGTTSPETLEELRHLEGHVGETRYDHIVDPTFGNLGYRDPYLNDGVTDADGNKIIRAPEAQPYLTYDDGTKISSRANLTYAECGGAQSTIEEGQSPVFCTGTQSGGDCSYWVFYRGVMNQCRNANVPFYGLISPECGHTFGTGPDKFYGIDTYAAFHRYANYWLQSSNPSCEIIDVDNPGFIGSDAEGFDRTNDSLTIDRVYEIGTGASVKIQFIGPVDGSEIGKVSIVDALAGEPLVGHWNAFFGNQQWEFVPYNIKEGTYYRVTVPTSIRAENGKCLAEEKTLTFRTVSGVTETTGTVEGSKTVTDRDGAYFLFDSKDYTEMQSVILRFTVKNEATNRIVITAVTEYNEENPSLSALGETLGEVAVYGAGAYTFDVTKYAKGKSGKIVFYASAKYTPGVKVLTDADFENSTVGAEHLLSSDGQIMAANASRTVIADETVGGNASKTMRLDYILPRASFVNLAGDLEGNGVNNHFDLISVYKGISENKLLTEEDLGRTIRFSFRLYDTTSRQIHIGAQGVENGKVVDFRAIDKTVRTVPGEWKTYTIEFTYEELISVTTLNRVTFVLSVENKTQALATDPLAIQENGRANAAGTTNARFPTKNGYNKDKFTEIDYLGREPEKETGIQVNSDKYFPLYFDDFLVEEIYTSVELFDTVSLVARPEKITTLPTTDAVTVGGEAPDGTLAVSGGSYGTDKESKKAYVAFDLSGYTGGAASVAFTARGVGTSFSVYGLRTATEWKKSDITAKNAPANDASSSGLLLSEVYGGAPLGSFTVGENGALFRLDITDYAKEMKAQGADTLTLIFVSDTETSEHPTVYTFTGAEKPDMGIKGNGEIHKETAGVFASVTDPEDADNSVLRLYPASSYMKAANAGFQMDLGGAIGTWSEADLGTSYLVTFRVRASRAGSFSLGMRKRYYCNWTEEDGTAASDPANWEKVNHPDCPTETVTVHEAGVWQTVTYRFTLANETMLPTRWRSSNYFYAVNQLAVSTYTGMDVGNYTGDAADLYLDIDDLSVTKVSGETEISIVDRPADATEIGSYDFDTAAPSFVLRQNGDKNNNDTWAANREGFAITDPDGDGNLAMTVYLRQIYNTTSHDRVSAQIELADALGAWTKDDIGKTYRVTFRVKANKEGSVTLGMMKEQFCNTGVEGSLTDGQPDAKNYAWSLYDGAPDTCPIRTLSVGTEWKTVTYEFTVDQKMLPIPRNATVSTEYGMTRLSLQTLVSGFGLTADDLDPDRTEASKDLWMAIDDVAVFEVTKSEKIPYRKQVDVTGWSDLSNYPMYTWADGFIEIRDGGILVYPAKNGEPQKRANGNANILFVNSLSEILTAENVGRTYHISFRAKVSEAGYLDYGFTTQKTATASGKTENLRMNFYDGTAGRAEFAESDAGMWKRFGFDFTVEAGMLSGNLSDTSAVLGFAVKFYNSYAYRDTDGVMRYRDVEIALSDLSVCEAEGAADTSSLPAADSVTITGDGTESGLLLKKGHTLPLENVKKTYLPFTTDMDSLLYSATLNLKITKGNGEIVTVYLAGDDTPIATFAATEGRIAVDLTDFLKNHKGESFTLVLASETLGEDILIDAGTEAPTLTIGSEVQTAFDPSSFRVKGNMTLSSDFLYHLYVPVLDGVTSLTLDGKILDLTTLPTAVIDGTLYYVTTTAIAPKNGTEEIVLNVTVNDRGTARQATYRVSIPKYAEKIISDTTGTYDDTTKTLMRDILAYIDAAMTYFGTSTEEKQKAITDIIGADYPPDLGAGDVGLTTPGTATDTGKALASVRLNLDATPSFLFYLEKGKESAASSFRFTSASGAPLTVKIKREESGEKRVYLEVTTYAYAMGDLLSFTYTDENGEESGTYHLAAYYLTTPAENTALQALVIRLAKYSASAAAYRASVQTGK